MRQEFVRSQQTGRMRYTYVGANRLEGEARANRPEGEVQDRQQRAWQLKLEANRPEDEGRGKKARQRPPRLSTFEHEPRGQRMVRQRRKLTMRGWEEKMRSREDWDDTILKFQRSPRISGDRRGDDSE